jgi:hypothetical protein
MSSDGDGNGDTFVGTEEHADASLHQVLGKGLDALTLCYLACLRDSGKRYVGAALACDHRTRPLEFIFVKPIQPSAMQKLLYGGTLDEHVTIDVISKRLVDGLARRPDILFVNSEQLLPLRRLLQIPVAYLGKQNGSDRSVAPNLSTVTYRVASSSGDDDSVAHVLSVLEPLVDLLDPFERISQAITETLKKPA